MVSAMQATNLSPDSFSRISKFHVDAQELSPAEADRLRAGHRVTLVLGEEVAGSATLQAAVLTAAATAVRCFPGAVDFRASSNPPVIVAWPGRRGLCDILVELGAAKAQHANTPASSNIFFGSQCEPAHGLQVTFDRWVGAVAPVSDGFRLRERDGCTIAGVLAGSLAIAEEFFRFALVHPEASLRQVGLSLWNPLEPWRADAAAGPMLAYLPSEFWLLGLGHLGQAYLWTLGLLPFSAPRSVELMLTDFDRVVPANFETGLLSHADHDGRLKTRVAMNWLEARGFKTRLVERAFDERTCRQKGEPRLALAGFDGSGPRWALDHAGFAHVIDCGLGGSADNFETIAFHTLPHPDFSAEQLWPQAGQADNVDRARALSQSNAVYEQIRLEHGCGEFELASRSVAVPFVGTTAASLALAEAARAVLGDVRLGSAHVRISALNQGVFRHIDKGYAAGMAPVIAYQPSAASL